MDRRATDLAPPGWDTNPSAWNQRLPIVGVAFVGLLIAVYLSLYQYGVVTAVWDPFFGDGSRKILTSRVSNILPIKDAALGAVGYLLDMISGAAYGQDRWRTHPWVVIVFGLAVGPLGGGSILLVILQPVLLNAFCTLCLASATISVLMIGPALDEVLASLQFLRRVNYEGRPVWRAFWGIGDSTDPALSGGVSS